MERTNEEFSRLIESIHPLLDRTDIIGYAVARNMRIISNEIQEYLTIKEIKMREFGEIDPNDPNRLLISVDSENYMKFVASMEEIAQVKHTVDVFKIKYDQVAGILSGNDILAIDWMLED